jgi:hypothetical protein
VATSIHAASFDVPVTMMSEAPRLLADHDLGEPLLTRALNENCGIISHVAVEQRPFDAVRHRRHQSGQFRCDAVGHMVQDRVPRKVNVLRKAAPQMRSAFGRCVAITDAVGIEAPVGILAMTILAEMAPLTFAAGDVVLDEHEVALLETLAPGEFATSLSDRADVLVAHDQP